ncbi:hypothetical protein EI94DRAFT_1796349 [Lactarius quietus]|nr:hypothetical protein EI94DRAFT_1796349 [Lactarius quietus]
MSLSIVIPLDRVDVSSATSEEDKESSSVQSSPHSTASDVTCLSGTSPVTTSSTHRVSSRKPSSRSLAIFNRPATLTPPVVHWGASSDSPGSSSSTLVESPQEERVCGKLRSHLQTCLDENKLANRSVTMDNTVSYCAALKGFQVKSGLQMDRSAQQLLMHATMLDFALEESSHEGLTHILQGLDRGIEEFLDSLEELPFDLRNTQSLISSTSDILETKSALLGVASQLTQRADDKSLKRIEKRCRHERDMLLRSIRVLLDIVDFESRLQAKLSINASESINITPSPKKRIRFRCPTLSRRQSNITKPRDTPPASSPILPEPEEKDEEEDEYSFYANMAADVVSQEGEEEYWGVRMPAPVGGSADFFLSEESGTMQGATADSANDPDLLDTFLLCFRSFCDPIELAKALISRYEEQPRVLNRSQREAWPAYQSSVKARVLRLISTWIDQYWNHERDRIAGLHIKEFVSLVDEEFLPNERAEVIRKLNDRREEAIAWFPLETRRRGPSLTGVLSGLRVAKNLFNTEEGFRKERISLSEKSPNPHLQTTSFKRQGTG